MALVTRAGPPLVDHAACSLCGGSTPLADLAEARFLSPDVEEHIARDHPGWRRPDGGCPACVQQALLEMLLAKGHEALHRGIQDRWPLDAAAAFGALPAPLRLHADPRYTGAGVTVALVDAAFHPHPDLVRPSNRIKAWVDASREPVQVRRFGAADLPRWPGWDAREAAQWHGLMTSAVAAGNGALSHGLYRGLAPAAGIVLVQVREASGRITNAGIARALDWLRWEASALGIRVVNLSLGGDAVEPLLGNVVDQAVAALVGKGVTVVAAAGNDGVRRLVPPATSPLCLTIGGLDDHNTFDHEARALWHGNYGPGADGLAKPELVAPSLWVVAPILPASLVAEEAAELFARRARLGTDADTDARLASARLVTPHYQHVEGTSFAAPLVAGVVACVLEANPRLTPEQVRRVLVASAQPIPGVAVERQGAGALDAGKAVRTALLE